MVTNVSFMQSLVKVVGDIVGIWYIDYVASEVSDKTGKLEK